MRGRSRPLRHVRSLLKFTARVCFLVSSLCFAQAGGTVPASADWKEVATAMGRPGQPQPGDVMKFAMPRKDLHVMLGGVTIKPALALGAWAASRKLRTGLWSWATWYSPKMKCSR